MLQIIFQFGTFEGEKASFWTDLLISALGAFIGIAGAYGIYWFSIKQTRKDRLKYVAVLLRSIIPTALQQSSNCIEQAKQTKANPYNMPYLKLVANRDLNRLADKVDQEGLYHAFLNKYSRSRESYKNFQMIYAYIDYLDYLVNNMISFSEKTISSSLKRKKEYADSFRSAKEKIEWLTLDKNIQQAYPGYYNFIVQALDNFGNNNVKGENVVQSYTNLIAPVRDYLIKNGPLTSQNTELMFLLNNAVNDYTGIEKAAQFAAIDFDDYGKKLEELTEKLKIATEQLRRDFSVD